MEISRFPCKRLLRMPGSTTTRGRHVSRDIDTGRVAFCGTENISTPNLSYAAQYLACALPCERFPSALADNPCLGAGTVRYTFTVTDFHRLPFAGLPAHPSTDSCAVEEGALFDYVIGLRQHSRGALTPIALAPFRLITSSRGSFGQIRSLAIVRAR
jgi:hypothetical protein